jgi:hypothetical protein
VQALGGRAIPLLTMWYESDERWRGKLRQLALQPGSRWQWLLQWPWAATDCRAIAYRALLRQVPQQAASLLPTLRRQVLEGQMPRAEEAALLLAAILNAAPIEAELFQQNRELVAFYTADLTNRLGETAIVVVASVMRHGPLEETERLIRHFWPYRTNRLTNARFAISKLDLDGFMQNLLLLENGNPRERPSAALFFEARPSAPERVVPLLVTNLIRGGSVNLLQSVCDALAAYGTNARPALTQLTNLLAHPKEAVRLAASNAVTGLATQQ